MIYTVELALFIFLFSCLCSIMRWA